MTRFLAAFALLGIISSPALAGDVQGAKIIHIFTTKDDGVFIYFDRAVANNAGCGRNNSNRLAIKPSTPGGKSSLAVAMLAYTNNYSVNAWGDGTCNVWGDTESLNYLMTIK